MQVLAGKMNVLEERILVKVGEAEDILSSSMNCDGAEVKNLYELTSGKPIVVEMMETWKYERTLS